MLGLPPSVKIHLATTLVDMRKGIDGLRVVVDQTLKKDPLSGHLFVFVGKSRDNATFDVTTPVVLMSSATLGRGGGKTDDACCFCDRRVRRRVE